MLCSLKRWHRLTNLDVFGSIVRQPLVRLVADAQYVVLDAQVSDHLELLHLVNLPKTWMSFFSTAGLIRLDNDMSSDIQASSIKQPNDSLCQAGCLEC